MAGFSRRVFLETGAAATVAVGAAVMGRSKAQGDVNDRIKLAVLGAGDRGSHHLGAFSAHAADNVEIAVLCDPDRNLLEKKAADFERKNGVKIDRATDLRAVLDRKDVDAVVVATPNHWHALAAVWACQAGKDVYVEKPGSHVFSEGRKLIAAARKYNRIVQHGVQLRSAPAIQEAVHKIRDGAIGDVYMARAVVFRERPSIGRQPSLDAPPAHLDWNVWLGPAPERKFSENIHPYNWHWQWDFGNGEIGNQGVHEIDMCLWGLGLEGFPSEVSAMGGKYLWDDDKQVPEVLTATCSYPEQKKLVEIEVRCWASNAEDEVDCGNVFFGSEGVLLIYGYTRYKIIEGVGKKRRHGRWIDQGLGDHEGNFLKAMRSRKVEDQNGPVETAHYSSGVVHLCNAAYRTGRRLKFDPVKEQFADSPDADKLLVKEYRSPFEMPHEV